MRKNTKQRQKQKSSLVNDVRQLIGYISRRRQRQLGLLLLLMVASSLSEMVSLGAILPFLSALSNPDELLTAPQWQSILTLLNIETASHLVTSLAIAFIATVIIANSLRLLTLNVRTRLSAAISSDLSCQIYLNTLRQSYSFHVQHNSSDLMQTLVDDTNRLMAQVLRPLLTLLTDSILAVSLIGSLTLIDARVAISTAVVLGGTYTIIYRLRRSLLKRNSLIVSSAGQRKIKAVQESVGGVRDVLIAHTQNFFQASYQEAEHSFRQGQAANAILSGSPKFIVEAIAMTAIALLALTLGRDGDFSQVVPILGSFTLGAKRLLPALQAAFAGVASIQGARASLMRVLIALQRPVNPLQLLPTPYEPIWLEKSLKLEDIWFRYSDDGDWVLQNLNIEIAAKTTVAFVGSTGSGKSTTADLILGLLQPQKGTIWVDGQPLEGERLRQWQQGIAHVPQSIFLTDASIAENIAFAVPKEEIDFDQVRKAAHLAQIHDYIEELPAGYDTYVGERGVRLSGGQRQRIGIARALYRQASVIVFDEATSALDNATEKEVMAAINGLSHRFTIILIAHRLSTVEKCDKIFELNRGSLVAQGNYENLLTQSSSFRSMTQASK